MIRVTDPWNSPILSRLADWRRQRQAQEQKERDEVERRYFNEQKWLHLKRVREIMKEHDAGTPDWIHV